MDVVYAESVDDLGFKSVNIWHSYKQERDCLVHFLRLLAVCWPGAQSAWDNHALACNFAKYSPIQFFSLTDSAINHFNSIVNNPTPLKHVDTLPCNLSLMACFADINVSQGSVATYAMCGGILNMMHLTANLPRNLPVKKTVNI